MCYLKQGTKKYLVPQMTKFFTVALNILRVVSTKLVSYYFSGAKHFDVAPIFWKILYIPDVKQGIIP